MDERLAKMKLLSARHCVESLREKLTEGWLLTVILSVALSFVPLEAMPISFTL